MKRTLIYVSLAATLTLAACGGAPPIANPDARDPYENFNRQMFAVHQSIDRVALKPLAQAYNFIPQPLRTGARNFLNNIGSPSIFANDILQGEKARADITLTRFLMNSTIGIGGLFDPAAALGFPRHREDFGQTLAVYGMPSLGYAFTPVIGPTPWRDFGGRIIDSVFNPITYSGVGLVWTTGAFVLQGLDARARSIETLDEIEKTSIDFYASIRSLYYQNRKSEIENGKVNFDTLPDIEFEDFEDEE